MIYLFIKYGTNNNKNAILKLFVCLCIFPDKLRSGWVDSDRSFTVTWLFLKKKKIITFNVGAGLDAREVASSSISKYK